MPLRSKWVNSDELLTPFGQWIAARVPRVEYSRDPWGRKGEVLFRVYGLKPLWRLCLVDFTRTRFYVDKPAYTRLRLLGKTVFEINPQYSGLPKVR